MNMRNKVSGTKEHYFAFILSLKKKKIKNMNCNTYLAKTKKSHIRMKKSLQKCSFEFITYHIFDTSS